MVKVSEHKIFILFYYPKWWAPNNVKFLLNDK